MQLRYLQASRLDGAGVNLRDAAVRGPDGQPVGALVGVLVEPRARRLHYVVVDNGDRRQYLVPLGAIQLEECRRALRIVAAEKPAQWKEFDPTAFEEFSANDAVDAMFGGHATSAIC